MSEPLPAAWPQQMLSLPKDRWNTDYFYDPPGKHHTATFDIYSAAPDKRPGTADDTGNW